MLKYVDAKIVFSEIPNEITLAISISGCPCHCRGCHSSYLADDIGTPLDEMELTSLIEGNRGISCIAFMGGDAEPWEIHHMAMFIRELYPMIKVAWYSGREELHSSIGLNLQDFDFIKLGPYKEEYGPLDSKTTNQRLFKIVKGKLEDITYKFWKK